METDELSLRPPRGSTLSALPPAAPQDVRLIRRFAQSVMEAARHPSITIPAPNNTGDAVSVRFVEFVPGAREKVGVMYGSGRGPRFMNILKVTGSALQIIDLSFKNNEYMN